MKILIIALGLILMPLHDASAQYYPYPPPVVFNPPAPGTFTGGRSVKL
jgi:hypothetical protein